MQIACVAESPLWTRFLEASVEDMLEDKDYEDNKDNNRTTRQDEEGMVVIGWVKLPTAAMEVRVARPKEVADLRTIFL